MVHYIRNEELRTTTLQEFPDIQLQVGSYWKSITD